MAQQKNKLFKIDILVLVVLYHFEEYGKQVLFEMINDYRKMLNNIEIIIGEIKDESCKKI